MPATLTTRLVSGLGLSPEAENAVERFLKSYAEFAKAQEVIPILAFMPCKTRCVPGRFRWATAEEETSVGVLPAALPQIIREECSKVGITFWDLTPALNIDRSGGRLLFNAVTDSHLNAQGSEAVALYVSNQIARVGGASE